VDNVLLLGQVLVSFALMASILLQTRGAGLGATFGGDSSVYRSRRGIEKRLFQFTIVLAVLFVVFSIIAFKLGDANIVTQ
jgi:preprotein translocase subunit SecG